MHVVWSRALAMLALVANVGCGASSNGPVTLAESPGASDTSAQSVSAQCISSPTVSRGGACSAPIAADTLDDALARIALDRCSFGESLTALEASKLDPRDPRCMPDMLPLLAHPLWMPAYGAAFARDLDAAVASQTPVAAAIVAAAARRGTPVTRACEEKAWYADRAGDASPLATALADVSARRVDVSAVPLDLQTALAPIVRALATAAADVTAARVVDAKTQPALGAVPTWMLGVRRFELDADMVTALGAVDVDAIARSAARVALVVERARLARFAGLAVPDVDISTPFGAIVIRGPTNHTYEPGSPADGAAFVLDTGGDDVYHVAVGASTVARPVSVAVDLAGRDTYAYVETPVPADGIGRRLPSDGAGRMDNGRTLSNTPRQGAGVLGVGILLDLGDGSDTYRSLVGSQGVGTHGVGVLYDEAGDDTYAAEGFSQGAAAWGVGLLIDGAGDDARTLYTSGQGFGFTRAVGVLYDRAGDDTYVAFAGAWNGAPPSLAGDSLYPSAQLPGPPTTDVTGNWSLAQGVGAGHRPDWPDPGFPMPGGIGVLRDAAGRDAYGAGVFAQGAGFVQGLGMLLDDGGDDRYDALYYAQGAAAHMGLALFDDRAGSDVYDAVAPIQAAALGLAHDLSIAVHLDEAGDDTYAAPALSLGTAEDNGLGVFLNAGGTDSFTAPDGCLGDVVPAEDVSEARQRMPTVAVFVKAGGSSRYRLDHADRALSGKSWCDAEDARKAIGMDRPNGTLSVR